MNRNHYNKENKSNPKEKQKKKKMMVKKKEEVRGRGDNLGNLDNTLWKLKLLRTDLVDEP